MFSIELCRVAIEIDNRFGFVESLCKDYILKDEKRQPAFRVSVSLQEIRQYQASISRWMDDGEAESYLVYRAICGRMPAFGAYLLHAAVVYLDGRAYAFSAPRGQGKTTHTDMWESLLHAQIINGDKPLISVDSDGCVSAWGTPWCGKEGKQINTSVPLSGICFLEKGQINQIYALSVADAVSQMLLATMLPPTQALQDGMAELIGKTLKALPTYRLSCRPDSEAVMLSYRVMSKH